MATLMMTAEQMNRLALSNRSRLETDLLQHLLEFRPKLFETYPMPYLHWVVQDTLDIAAGFGLADVEALRVFVQLRFDVAPGFWREPAIAQVLGRRDLPPMARWQMLSEEPFGDAWLRAAQYQGAGEWRERYWGTPE
jgi:hypothetical protein